MIVSINKINKNFSQVNKLLKLLVLFLFYLLIFITFFFNHPENIYSSKITDIDKLNNYTKFKVENLNEEKTVVVHIFYSDDCDLCSIVLDRINNINSEGIEFEIIKYELSTENNLDLMFFLLDEYGYESMDYSIPVVFVGNSFYIGPDETIEGFEKKIKENHSQDIYDDKVSVLISAYKENLVIEDRTSYIKIPAIIISAFADSINPCAIGVIIFLVSSLIASSNRRYAITGGIIYICTIFIIYTAIGLGFIYFVRTIKLPAIFFMVLAAILILFGLFSVKDFFWYQKGLSLKIPEPIKKIIQNNIQKATIISILFIGVLVSLFEAACSGAIYLGILSMIASEGIRIYSMLLLLLYNFIFILPLIIILLIFYFGIPARKIQRLFIQKNKRIYRLILGIILISLGVYIIFYI